MLFDKPFLDSLAGDPIGGAIQICDRIFELTADSREWAASDYEAFMEGFALLEGMVAANLLDQTIVPFYDPDLSASMSNACFDLNKLFAEVRAECVTRQAQSRFSKQKAHYGAQLGAGFVYEFSQGDLDRVQELLNQLREAIKAAKFFTDDHQRRLLLKLEQLQAEAHKKMSSLDKFWSILGEAGVLVGKFGTDAKPMFDRMNEVLRIVWRTQARAEDLPSSAPAPLPADQQPQLPGADNAES